MGSIRPPDFGGARSEPVTASRPTLLVAPLQPRPLSADAAPLARSATPFVPFVPVRAFPGFWPQAGASLFAAGSDWYQCAATRSGLFVPAYLPSAASPFASPACGQDWSATGDADGIRSLTPAHNKDALYGPAYNPTDFGTP